MILTLVFLALYALYAYFHTDKTKPTAWMVGDVAWLVLAGLLFWKMQDFYMWIGVGVAAGSVAYNYFVNKLPLATANVWTYAKTALTCLVFWPVSVFEEVYAKLGAKISAL